jgi:hypothetical protein
MNLSRKECALIVKWLIYDTENEKVCAPGVFEISVAGKQLTLVYLSDPGQKL